ncbi:hypothetical protein [Tahibacter soli]|uniref:Uncharacterized protein n=1 Tax=Tahibacter soli TaxID=2983605 RepID=A0A9X3YPK7_9GAMM|nr:hypothetical protein [Tahibacter soli]MDC8015512.1 hypothetical protein [Tahibacter soli]
MSRSRRAWYRRINGCAVRPCVTIDAATVHVVSDTIVSAMSLATPYRGASSR